MVPPAPPVDAEAREAARRGLTSALALAGDRLLVVVEGGSPQSLVDVWRTLRASAPEARALRHAPELLELPSGGAALLRLLPDEAAWLNANRGLLGSRRWRLVVWVAAPGLDDLRRQAPDFFDWASHVWRIGAVAADHAIRGVREALDAGRPVAWTGGDLEPVIASLGAPVTRISALLPWAELREATDRAGLRVVEDVTDGWTATRARWAEAQASRKISTGHLPPIWIATGPWPRGAVSVNGCWSDPDALPADALVGALGRGLEPTTSEPALAPDERPDDPVPRVEAILRRGSATVEAVEIALDLFHLDVAEAWTEELAEGPTARLLHARRLWMAGRPAEASALLEGLPKVSGDDRAREILMRAHLHQDLEQNWDEALASAVTADVRARVGLSWAWRLFERGDLDAAERRVEGVLGWWAGAVASLRARVARLRGDADAALRWLRGVALPEAERTLDTREVAEVTWAIADVLSERGELDEPLRLYREVALPITARLGDRRAKARTLASIAGVLIDRGEFDEAARLLREEVLPVQQALGTGRDRAVSLARLAYLMEARGELQEALNLRRELLPVFVRDPREFAVVQSSIAEVLTAMGRPGEALQLLQRDVLPVHERLGHLRDLALARIRVAAALERGGDPEEALATLKDVLPFFVRLGDARMQASILGSIAGLLSRRGQVDEALQLRRDEQLPIYQRLGLARDRAIALVGIADLLQARGDETSARRACEEAMEVFQRLGDPLGIAAAQHALARGERAFGHALAALERLRSVATADLPAPVVLAIAVERISLARDLGLPSEVVALVPKLLPLARDDASTLAWLTRVAADAHAALGRREEAARWFREGAIPAAEVAADPRALAAARLALASLLAEDSSRRAEVRHLLKAARDGAEAADLQDLAEEARSLLRRR